jgi:hypothetical protein
MDLNAAVGNHASRSTRPQKSSASGRDVSVPIVRSGILARKFCHESDRAEIAAVFERSVYLRATDMFLCIGTPAIGNGPITMIGDFGPSNHLADLGLSPGLPVSISERSIAIGGSIRFTFEQCELWRPSGWPLPQTYPQLTDACDDLVRLARAEAPAEGFAQVYRSRERGTDETPLARIARARVARFQSWLCDTLETDYIETTASVDATRGLIGLGPGLTPSGDDFLVGALAVLDALAERKALAALAHAIAAAPRGLTSPLSGYLLRAAAAGHVGEPLCRAVSAVISGMAGTAVAAIRNIGHSSGWDMLVGVMSALRVVAGARQSRALRLIAIRRFHSSRPHQIEQAFLPSARNEFVQCLGDSGLLCALAADFECTLD